MKYKTLIIAVSTLIIILLGLLLLLPDIMSSKSSHQEVHAPAPLVEPSDQKTVNKPEQPVDLNANKPNISSSMSEIEKKELIQQKNLALARQIRLSSFERDFESWDLPTECRHQITQIHDSFTERFKQLELEHRTLIFEDPNNRTKVYEITPFPEKASALCDELSLSLQQILSPGIDPILIEKIRVSMVEYLSNEFGKLGQVPRKIEISIKDSSSFGSFTVTDSWKFNGSEHKRSQSESGAYPSRYKHLFID